MPNLTEATAATLRPAKVLRNDRFKGLLAIGRKAQHPELVRPIFGRIANSYEL